MTPTRRYVIATAVFVIAVLGITVLARTGYRYDRPAPTTVQKPVTAMNCAELKTHYRMTVRPQIEASGSGSRDAERVVERADALRCADLDSW